MIMWNGLDSTKEHMYSSGFPHELAARGISTLMVDCPGSGEALRLQGLTARIDTEAWASACVDYLLTRADVDPHRIGLVGWSLGGYYAPRAAAFEKRLALGWRGARTTTGAPCNERGSSARASDRCRTTGSTYCGCGGYDDLDDFLDVRGPREPGRRGRAHHCAVPDRHGENDRQIPVRYAHRSYEQAVNSPKRELRIFTPDEGATEHIGLDHLERVSVFMADWVADTLAGEAHR